MEWRGDGTVRWLEADLPGGRAAFSTRSAGSVKESHAQLAASLGLSADRIAMGKQVHGTELAIHKTQRSGVEAVDGHVVSAPGMAAMVYVADCLPVALGGWIWWGWHGGCSPRPGSGRSSRPGSALAVRGSCSSPTAAKQAAVGARPVSSGSTRERPEWRPA